MTPGPCQMCGAEDWHPPWGEDHWLCKRCGNQPTPAQLEKYGRGHVRLLPEIDIPLGPADHQLEGNPK